MIMTISNTQIIKCRRCEKENEVIVYRHVDVAMNPELREKVLDGTLNMFKCSECFSEEKFDLVFKYIDPVNKFALLYTSDEDDVKKLVKYETERAYEREYNESENFLKKPIGISDYDEFRNTILVNEKLDRESEKIMIDELSRKDDFEFYESVRDKKKLRRHSDMLFYIDRIIVRNQIEDKIQKRLREDLDNILKGVDPGKVLGSLLGNLEKVKQKYIPDDKKESNDNSNS